jgi:hypothetical protein
VHRLTAWSLDREVTIYPERVCLALQRRIYMFWEKVMEEKRRPGVLLAGSEKALPGAYSER